MNSCIAFLKHLWQHILYLRNNPLKPKKESLVEIAEPKTLPHEILLDLLNELDESRISRVLPLDTQEKQIIVYGNNYIDYYQATQVWRALLMKHHTLTRRDIIPLRMTYGAGDFFIIDGFFHNKREALSQLLSGFRDIAREMTLLHATVEKTSVDRYNLKLLGIIISDMLTFVEKLNLEPVHLPADHERHR